MGAALLAALLARECWGCCWLEQGVVVGCSGLAEPRWLLLLAAALLRRSCVCNCMLRRRGECQCKHLTLFASGAANGANPIPRNAAQW